MKSFDLYTRSEIAAARKTMRSFGCSSLLSDPSSNPKTEKNGKLVSVLTAPLHLAPYKLSGYQVCPMASKGCAATCLHSAGNPAYFAAKEKARIARTKFFFEAREAFLIVLYAEMRRHTIKALSKDMVPGFRLNATSDIGWETYKLPNTANTLFEEFSEASFYDYTKIRKRMVKFLDGTLPENYYLTFSATESNWNACKQVLNAGGTVAAAFNIRRGQPMITEYDGYPVIDADTHDYRVQDPKGSIAGLRAKGKAITDTSGFVKIVQVWQKKIRKIHDEEKEPIR